MLHCSQLINPGRNKTRAPCAHTHTRGLKRKEPLQCQPLILLLQRFRLTKRADLKFSHGGRRIWQPFTSPAKEAPNENWISLLSCSWHVFFFFFFHICEKNPADLLASRSRLYSSQVCHLAGPVSDPFQPNDGIMSMNDHDWWHVCLWL